MILYEIAHVKYKDKFIFEAGRPGTCSKIGSAVGSICIDECVTDYTCPIGEKCCSSGCGNICMKPVDGGGELNHILSRKNK